MNNRCQILAPFYFSLLECHGIAYASATDSYYCPRSDVFLMQQTPTLENEGLISAIGGGVKEPFIRNQSGRGGEALWFETKGCSTNEYECVEFLQKQFQKPDKHFYLAAPKKISMSGTYHFHNLELIVQRANIPVEGPSGSNRPAIHVTIWQNINGAEKPIDLTLEYKRGVVFLDGLDFWDQEFGAGETCVLVGRKGLLSNILIDLPKKTSSSIE
jgi:hypothetical protein